MVVRLPVKKRRYSNIRRHVAPDGTKLDSKRELERYLELVLLQQCGAITELVVHPRFPIEIAGVPILIKSKRYPNGRKLTYVADFCYRERGRTVIEDVKMQSGHRTEVYKIKRALMDAMGHIIQEY